MHQKTRLNDSVNSRTLAITSLLNIDSLLISPSDEAFKDVETPSQPDVELDSSNKAEPEDEWTFPMQSFKKLKKPSKSRRMRQAFEGLSYEAGKIHEGLHQRCAVRENSSTADSYIKTQPHTYYVSGSSTRKFRVFYSWKGSNCSKRTCYGCQRVCASTRWCRKCGKDYP